MNDEQSGSPATMDTVVAETMESMAFLEVQSRPTPPAYDEDAMWVSLLVLDPVQGEMQLVMEKELVHYLLDIVYGGIEGVASEQGKNDLLAEFLNTITGRFLGASLPSDRCFQLGLPEMGRGVHSWPDPPARNWHYQVEGMHLSLTASGEPLLALLEQKNAGG
ncbi:MAG: hypothetical protein ACOY3Z_04640 [Thermodesulfobacteriota bacterium]